MAVDEKQYITFKLEEDYGIELIRIKEIIRRQELTVIPEAPQFIMGILNLRGIAVPVVNMRRLFQLAEKEVTEYSVIIVVEILGRLVGGLVDQVSDIIAIKSNEIKSPPQFSERKGTNKAGSRSAQRRAGRAGAAERGAESDMRHSPGAPPRLKSLFPIL